MEAPQAYKNAGIANLVGGVLGIFYSGIWFLSTIWICVGIYFLLPMAMSAFTAYVGWQMYQGQVSPQAKTASMVGIATGFLSGMNLFTLGACGFAFMQLGDDQVAGWLEQNGVS